MKRTFTAVIIIATFAALVLGITFIDGFDNLKRILTDAEPKFLLIIVGCMAAYWLMQSLILQQLFLNRGTAIPLQKAIKANMIGEFFSAVTPLATGGQPLQVVYFSKLGIPAGISTSVLGIHLFFYHIARLALSVFLTLWFADVFYSGSAFTYMLLIGLVVNVILAIFMVSAALRPKGIYRVGSAILRGLAKIRLVKHLEAADRKMQAEIEGFYLSIREFKDQKRRLFLLVFAESLCYLIVYYAITYYVFLSFGIDPGHVGLILGAQCSVSLISAYIPMPGGSFGAEGAFYVIFSKIVEGGAPIFAAILLWRVLTYYFTLTVGSLFTLKLE